MRRRIFPTGDFGIERTNTYARGRLKSASSDALQYVSSASASSSPRRVTNAVILCPSRSSGSPATATSATPGWSESTLSISTGITFSPPEIIMSSTRPVTKRSPSASKQPMSPVKYQPPWSAFASASGRRQ